MPATPHRLAFWTWLLPLPLLHLATWLSLATQFSDGAALWYLPFALALGLVLVLWWGPRVLVAVYINALVSIPLWGLAWQWAPLVAGASGLPMVRAMCGSLISSIPISASRRLLPFSAATTRSVPMPTLP